jgi:hypothetical protein
LRAVGPHGNRGLFEPPFNITGGSSDAASIAINLSHPAFATRFFVPKTALFGRRER